MCGFAKGWNISNFPELLETLQDFWEIFENMGKFIEICWKISVTLQPVVYFAMIINQNVIISIVQWWVCKWWSMSVQQFKDLRKQLPIYFASFVHMKCFCRSCGLVKWLPQTRACERSDSWRISHTCCQACDPINTHPHGYQLKGSSDRSSANANPGKIRYSRHACDFWCMGVLSFKWWIINSDAKKYTNGCCYYY